MKLNVNLAMAKQAVKYVRSKMTIGALNKVGDVFKSWGASLLCVPAIRSVEIAGENTSMSAAIEVAASKAETVGCGNCGEQAALAFVYLRDHGVRPLDYMHLTNADHAFVVIDRTLGSKDSDYSTWGVDAVVCDPWHEKAYSAAEIPLKMYGGGTFGAKSDHRLD